MKAFISSKAGSGGQYGSRLALPACELGLLFSNTRALRSTSPFQTCCGLCSAAQAYYATAALAAMDSLDLAEKSSLCSLAQRSISSASSADDTFHAVEIAARLRYVTWHSNKVSCKPASTPRHRYQGICACCFSDCGTATCLILAYRATAMQLYSAA